MSRLLCKAEFHFSKINTLINRETAGSFGQCMFDFTRDSHVFQSGRPVLHLLRHVSASCAPFLTNMPLSIFFILDVLSMKWYLVVVLFCFFLMTIYMSIYFTCLFICYLYNLAGEVPIQVLCPVLGKLSFANIFSQPVACLFFCLIVS